MNFAKFLRTPLLTTHSVAASVFVFNACKQEVINHEHNLYIEFK